MGKVYKETFVSKISGVLSLPTSYCGRTRPSSGAGHKESPMKVKALFLLMAIALMSLLSVSVASAANYYVATNGNNNNQGSESQPWATISYAESRVKPGDTVYVRGGRYTEQVWIDVSGTASAPITFKNYGMEIPILDGGSSYPWNAGIPTNESGLMEIRASYIVIEGFEVRNSREHGINIDGRFLAGGKVYGVVVRKNHVHTCYGSGVFFMGTDGALAENNEVHNCANNNFVRFTSRNPGGYWACGMGNNSSIRTTFRRNRVYGNHGEGLMLDKRNADCLVEYNEIYGNRALELYLNCGRNATARYNLLYGSDDYLSNNIVIASEQEYCFPEGYNGGHKIYGNLAANGRSGFEVWHWRPTDPAFQNVKVYNNTFAVQANPYGNALIIDSPMVGFEFKNNIVWQPTGNVVYTGQTTGMSFDYNLWSRQPLAPVARGPHDPPYATPNLVKASGWESLGGGVLSGSEFALQADSAAVGKGAWLGAEFAQIPDCNQSDWKARSVVLLNQDGQGGSWEIGADVHAVTVAPPSTLSAPKGLTGSVLP
jgi:nitrous oxidase accessory protein NosD